MVFPNDVRDPSNDSCKPDELADNNLTNTALSLAVEALKEALHNEGKLRVGSLVISFIGDGVVPRGGRISLNAITATLDLLGVKDNAVRTAISRLTRTDWLERSKSGRHTFYSFSDMGRRSFDAASPRVYSSAARKWEDRWLIAIAPDEDVKRRAQRQRELSLAGFGNLNGTLFLRPLNDPGAADLFGLAGCHVMEASTLQDGIGTLPLSQAWPLAEIADRYVGFITQHRGLGAALEQQGDIDPGLAMAARLLLVHNWRRVVLRDPELPPQLLPDNWPRAQAEALTARIYHALLDPSEDWLSALPALPEGSLPPSGESLSGRLATHTSFGAN